MTSPTRQTLQILQLLHWPGVGIAKVRRVLRLATEDAPLLEQAAKLLQIPPSEQAKAHQKAAAIVHDCEDLGIHILGLEDEGYPPLLRNIADAPPILFARGNLEALTSVSVAVVGTRQASEAGLLIARTIAEALVQRHMTVASGLAIGIDAAAHQGAIDAGGRTVAILAHGLHTISPARNRAIGEAMLERGALLSEHPPGVPARRAEFVRRNRLQSGMSICSIVVESGVEGGAIHQANFTRKQGRPLLTVLRSSPQSGSLNEAGARHLISQLGATPISTTGELARQLDRIHHAGAAAQAPLL